jgi:hypothetical protein
MGMVAASPHQSGRKMSAANPSTMNVSQKIFRSTTTFTAFAIPDMAFAQVTSKGLASQQQIVCSGITVARID